MVFDKLDNIYIQMLITSVKNAKFVSKWCKYSAISYSHASRSMWTHWRQNQL